jgi:hypothetical protein
MSNHISISIIIQEYVEPSLSVTTYERKTFDENILIATADGFMHFFNENGDKIWASEMEGGALISSFHPIRTEPDMYPSHVDSVGTMIPSIRGSVLSYIGGELRTLGLSVSELVAQTPKLASDGTMFLGSKQTRGFGVNIKDGQMVEMGSEGKTSDDGVAWFVRVDYMVRSVQRGSGTELWNFSFSQLQPLSSMPDVKYDSDHNVDDSQEEAEGYDECAVDELLVRMDGSLTKINTRGEESPSFQMDLTSPISSAFSTNPLRVFSDSPKGSGSGVLLLPSDDSDDDDVPMAVKVKELNIRHHLSSSSDDVLHSEMKEPNSMALVAQVESSQFKDYLSLFAVEYLANRKDIDGKE